MDMDAKELASVDVGEAARFGNRYSTTTPTPLTELIAWLKSRPGVRAFVEV